MQGTHFRRTPNFDWAIANCESFSGREIFASLPDQPASCLLGFRCGWDGRFRKQRCVELRVYHHFFDNRFLWGNRRIP
jgi:hypothetical protein